MRVLRYWRVSLGAAVALSVSLAFAADPVPAVTYPECSRKPTPADLEGAKGAHKAASQFYDRGDYDKAIRYWSDAYSFDCTAHSVLINIANAYEKKGDKPSAIAALETYVRRTGPDPTLEEKIRNLKQSLVSSPPPPATTPTATVTPPPSASGGVGVGPVPTSSPSAVPTAPPPTTVRPYGLAPWVVVGGGGVSLLAGLIMTPVGVGEVNTATMRCPDRKCMSLEDVNLGNRGRLNTGIGIAALTVGGVVMAGGLVWQLMFNAPREIGAGAPATPGAGAAAQKGGWQSHVSFSPMLGPGQAGVGVSGTF